VAGFDPYSSALGFLDLLLPDTIPHLGNAGGKRRKSAVRFALRRKHGCSTTSRWD
jgi:hypothetical protein